MFGANKIRGEIVRVLAQHPEGMTSGAIERELGTAYQTIFRHLQALVAAGAVQTDGDEVHQGRRVIYTLDRESITRTLDEYRAYLLAE